MNTRPWPMTRMWNSPAAPSRSEPPGKNSYGGITVSVDVLNFPAPGETGRFVWNESTRHLELAEISSDPRDTDPPSPPHPQGTLYWVSNSILMVSPLAGTQQRETPFHVPSDTYPSHLTTDPIRGKLYWMKDPRDGELII